MSSFDINHVADVVTTWMQQFFRPGEVTELRVLEARTKDWRKPHTEAGFYDYDHLRDLVFDALRLSPYAKGTYFVMNPLRQEILSRRANRVDPAGSDFLSHDRDVLFRRWMLIDVDPIRDPLISATDSEKAAARQVIDEVREYLAIGGWPDPIVADSGNGYHLFYRIREDTEDGDLIRRTLNALGDRFDSDHAKVDRKVFNPARIVKVPGTLSRKGDHTPDRPHRRGRLLFFPGVGNLENPISLNLPPEEEISIGGESLEPSVNGQH